MQLSDWLIVSRNGTNFKSTVQTLLNLFSDELGTTEFTVADITARDLLTVSIGDRVMVTDASSDAGVTAGWAIYTWTGSAFKKVAEEEGLDVIIELVNLGRTVAPSGITITNSSSGTGTNLPLGDAVNAGLIAPADFQKLQFVTVTGAVNLDTLLTNSHLAVTTTGTSQNNPIHVDSNQVLSFDIDGLDTLA